MWVPRTVLVFLCSQYVCKFIAFTVQVRLVLTVQTCVYALLYIIIQNYSEKLSTEVVQTATTRTLNIILGKTVDECCLIA